MKHETYKCRNCVDRKNCRGSRVSWFFFALGLIATVAIRIVTVLMEVKPLYGKIAWYVGVGGFVIFFIYHFRIHQDRAQLIAQEHLFEKVNQKESLSDKDYTYIAAILCKLRSKKERINYFFIFIASAIALILAIYFDFIK